MSPELLRAWETRYALLVPGRTSGGFRLYEDEDETRVRDMLRFLARGMAAAEAARLVRVERGSGTAVRPDARDLPTRVAGELRRALDDFNDLQAHAVLDRAFSAYGLEVTLRDVVVPYLQELGDRWERGAASVAQEHFATGLLRGRLLSLARGWGAGADARALLAGVPGDHHDLGLICFGLALHLRGWSIVFLGADTPPATILETIRQIQPALVVMAASLGSGAADCASGLTAIASAAPLALGGRGSSAALAEAVGARYLPGDPIEAAAQIAPFSEGPDGTPPRRAMPLRP